MVASVPMLMVEDGMIISCTDIHNISFYPSSCTAVDLDNFQGGGFKELSVSINAFPRNLVDLQLYCFDVFCMQ